MRVHGDAMGSGMRSNWIRGAILALLGTALFVPAGSASARLKIVELRDGQSVAGASSIRVGDFSGDGMRTNGRILGFDPKEGDYSCRSLTKRYRCAPHPNPPPLKSLRRDEEAHLSTVSGK